MKYEKSGHKLVMDWFRGKGWVAVTTVELAKRLGYTSVYAGILLRKLVSDGVLVRTYNEDGKRAYRIKEDKK